ncbi:MAG: DoxX family protein [Gemmatimonadales bacterium]|nr:DoxX family protein [Gemmatimonadales bacterium]
MSPTVITLMQAFVAMSVFYVWVVRYQAVLADFAAFQLPDWLRDLVGALKLTGVALLLGVGDGLEGIGAAMIGVFMVGAVMMHLRVKNPLIKMLPSFCLGLMALFIAMHHYLFRVAATG